MKSTKISIIEMSLTFNVVNACVQTQFTIEINGKQKSIASIDDLSYFLTEVAGYKHNETVSKAKSLLLEKLPARYKQSRWILIVESDSERIVSSRPLNDEKVLEDQVKNLGKIILEVLNQIGTASYVEDGERKFIF